MEKNKYGYFEKRLLKKKHQKITKILFSRIGLITLLFLFQLFIFISILRFMVSLISYYVVVKGIFVLVMSLGLINSKMDPTAKITWLVLIAATPVFGSLLLWYTSSEVGKKKLKESYSKTSTYLKENFMNQSCMSQTESSLQDLQLSFYASKTGPYALYKNEGTTYLKDGNTYFKSLMKDLNNAKKYIFLEYFIIEEGIFFSSILHTLIEKAKKGVEVKILCDGTCEFITLSSEYQRKLKELGIEFSFFSPLLPFVSTTYNYRDHRKIVVIDGEIAYTGGINLADEYIEEKILYGKWIDNGLRIEGKAVESFIYMFYQMWTINKGFFDLKNYIPSSSLKIVKTTSTLLPFGDCPIDNEKVGEEIYMNILNIATSFVYITTPYLILDSEIENALCFAAKRGIDVRILLPGIPDKKIPYILAKTHYKTLLNAGVRIYEYSKGFVHAKTFISDHNKAVCGTINLDYRSLYHHFEDAVYLKDAPCIIDMESHFLNLLEESKQIRLEDVKKIKPHIKLIGALLKVIATLL